MKKPLINGEATARCRQECKRQEDSVSWENEEKSCLQEKSLRDRAQRCVNCPELYLISDWTQHHRKTPKMPITGQASGLAVKGSVPNTNLHTRIWVPAMAHDSSFRLFWPWEAVTDGSSNRVLTKHMGDLDRLPCFCFGLSATNGYLRVS